MLGAAAGAEAGMGMLNAGIQAAMGAGLNRKQKKLNELNRGLSRRETQEKLDDITQEGQQTQHGAFMQEQGNEGQANDRGVADSSIPEGENKEVEYQKGQRLQSLNRRKNNVTANAADQEKMWKIQREMDRSQQQMSIISSFLQNGASGMGALGRRPSGGAQG